MYYELARSNLLQPYDEYHIYRKLSPIYSILLCIGAVIINIIVQYFT